MIHQPADEDSNRNEPEGGKHHFRGVGEGLAGNGGEHSHNEDKGQENKEAENDFGITVKDVFSEVGY